MKKTIIQGEKVTRKDNVNQNNLHICQQELTTKMVKIFSPLEGGLQSPEGLQDPGLINPLLYLIRSGNVSMMKSARGNLKRRMNKVILITYLSTEVLTESGKNQLRKEQRLRR